MVELVLVFLIALCWGSFLNVVGYRIIREKSLLGRSFCPSCTLQLAWYDLLPVISWINLWGRCRSCSTSISILYPFIELLTATLFVLMFTFIESQYWLGYGIFFSALIVTIRTDFERMLISRFMTWWMIPIAFLLCVANGLPLSLAESIAGALFGYILLWITARIFFAIRKIEGLGEGDLDLLALIGAFTGIAGAWCALFLGAFFGTLVGLIMLIRHRKRQLLLAFGPWLAFGALIYVFLRPVIYNLFD